LNLFTFAEAMRIHLLLAAALWAGCNFGLRPPKADKAAISGSVTATHRHCGGMAPTEELLQELATPHPLPGKKFYLVQGDVNRSGREIILTFVTDAAGNFSFKVAPGRYAVLLEEQIQDPNPEKYKSPTQEIDETCYRKWWARPYYLLEIPVTTKPATIKGLNFNFQKRCFIESDVPCLTYTGPAPP
jgi:hypothetical protein